jgi:hypothetical protein
LIAAFLEFFSHSLNIVLLHQVRIFYLRQFHYSGFLILQLLLQIQYLILHLLLHHVADLMLQKQFLLGLLQFLLQLLSTDIDIIVFGPLVVVNDDAKALIAFSETIIILPVAIILFIIIKVLGCGFRSDRALTIEFAGELVDL